MSWQEKIKNYFSRIREKHKLVFVDDSDYKEKWRFRVSMLNLFSLLGLYTIVVTVLLFLLVRFTPLSTFFAEDIETNTTTQVEAMNQQLDSLTKITESRQKYLDDLKKILNQESFEDSTYLAENDSLRENYEPDFQKSPEDSILREKVESDGLDPETERADDFEFFFSPVEGVISQSFNPRKKHFGVDVVTEKDDPVKSCLDGTIIMTGWQASEGKIVIIQHANNLVSVYKHCSIIVKKQGTKVQSGDPVAIVGNTGENSSGPHLHFELWENGKPVDPQNFISF